MVHSRHPRHPAAAWRKLGSVTAGGMKSPADPVLTSSAGARPLSAAVCRWRSRAIERLLGRRWAALERLRNLRRRFVNAVSLRLTLEAILLAIPFGFVMLLTIFMQSMTSVGEGRSKLIGSRLAALVQRFDEVRMGL